MWFAFPCREVSEIQSDENINLVSFKHIIGEEQYNEFRGDFCFILSLYSQITDKFLFFVVSVQLKALHNFVKSFPSYCVVNRKDILFCYNLKFGYFFRIYCVHCEERNLIE